MDEIIDHRRDDTAIDAADGELARLKNTPSYVGRYLDSVFDIVLNFLILMTICYVSKTTIWFTILAFIGVQLQGTLYNYYYVILRNKSVGGDTTSKIFEYQIYKYFCPAVRQKSYLLFVTTYKFDFKQFKIEHQRCR